MVLRPLLCSRNLLFLYQRVLTNHTCLQRPYSTLLNTSFKKSLLEYSLTKDINALIKQLPTHGPESTSAYLYNAALNKCVKIRQFDHMDQIMALMKERGVQMDRATYNILLRIELEQPNITQQDMFKLYQKMISQSIRPSIVTFNTFIKYTCQHKYWEALPQWLSLMEEHGLKPNRITAQTIFKCLVLNMNDPFLSEAFDKVSSAVPEASYEKELFWNAAIVALVKDNKADVALDILNMIFSKEKPQTTNTYNTMILTLCRQGNLESAHQLLDSMIHNNKIPNPDIVTFTTLIHAIVKQGGDEVKQLDDIVKLYKKLQEQGLRSNNVLNSVLLAYFVKNQHLHNQKTVEKMYRLVLSNRDEARTQSQSGDVELVEMYIYNMLIDFYFSRSRLKKSGRIPEQPFVLLKHAMNQRKLKPTTSTMNIFVRGLAIYHNDLKAAETTMNLLMAKGVPWNERTIWLLVKAAFQQGKKDRAYHWIQTYEKENVIKGDGLLYLKNLYKL